MKSFRGLVIGKNKKNIVLAPLVAFAIFICGANMGCNNFKDAFLPEAQNAVTQDQPFVEEDNEGGCPSEPDPELTIFYRRIGMEAIQNILFANNQVRARFGTQEVGQSEETLLAHAVPDTQFPGWIRITLQHFQPDNPNLEQFVLQHAELVGRVIINGETSLEVLPADECHPNPRYFFTAMH